MKRATKLAARSFDWQRELAAGRPLLEVVTSCFGAGPRFEVVSQRWVTVAVRGPEVERFSCYRVGESLVSLHVVHVNRKALPRSFVRSLLNGERLGKLLQEEGWERRGVEVALRRQLPLVLRSVPWGNRFFPMGPWWVRRFFLSEGDAPALRVWEFLPARVWAARDERRS